MATVLEKDIHEFASRFNKELKEELSGKTVLITGATGLIGSIMIRCLIALDASIDIVAPVRNISKAKDTFGDLFQNVKFIESDLTDLDESVDEEIDYIIHGAAPTASKYFVDHPVETISTIVELTRRILDFARSHKVKGLVFLSSLEVYGRILNEDKITENTIGKVDILDVRSSYPLAKQLAENLCVAYSSEYGVPVKIARLTQTTGPGIAKDDKRILAHFVRLATSGEDIVLHTTGKSARPYCYTTDAVAAILYILLSGERGHAYNVADEESYISAAGLARFVKDILGSESEVKVMLNENMGYAPTTFHNLSSEALRELGWSPHYQLSDTVVKLSQYLTES